VIITAAWASALAAFSLFLISLGLDPLPSSVLAKSSYATADSSAAVLMERLQFALLHPTVAVCIVVLVIDAVLARRWGSLHWFVALVVGLHAVAGDFGWFGRYEIYFVAAVTPSLVALTSTWMRRDRLGRWYVALAATSAVLALLPLAWKTVETPAAARDIHSQQAQTAAFVRDHWRQPIAVNDLGMVAYRGGQDVLDLWGLASAEAREARALGGSPQWPSQLMEQEGVELAAIYTAWFDPQTTASWSHVGTLTGTEPVSSGGSRVEFYATSPEARDEACSALEQFKRDVPSYTSVTTYC
jgi:hypothetical protein